MKKLGDRGEKREKIVSLLGYLLVGGFFLMLYLMMTMNYEDMLQQNYHIGDSLADIFVKIFNYIPRAGEFWQRTAVHFMTKQVSFGLDLIFRIITGVIGFAAIYLSTAIVLKRKPKLKYRDSLIFLGIFLLLTMSHFRQVATHSFAYIHNYMIAIVLMLSVIMPFWLKLKTDRPIKLTTWTIIGFLFGTANEIAPIAMLIMVTAYGGWQLKRGQISWKEIWKKEKLIMFMIAGIVAGLGFFYAGAGLSARTTGQYAKAYDYTPVQKIISEPVKTVAKLGKNFVYNFRHLRPLTLIVILIILSEITKKSRGAEDKSRLRFYAGVTIFILLYLTAVSQIKATDDLYWRFLIPCYFGIILMIMVYINGILKDFGEEKVINLLAAGAIIGVICVACDMAFGIIRYHNAVKPDLDKVYRNEKGELIVDYEKIELKNGMQPSPLFKFKQASVFDY